MVGRYGSLTGSRRVNGDVLLNHPRDIAAFAHCCLRVGMGVALVFVTAVEGGSLRAPGLRMAIAADGRTIGFVSNGCVEADLIARAHEARARQRAIAVAYGSGSGKLDIVLPCGGRVDILIVPANASHEPALRAMAGSSRVSGTLELMPAGAMRWKRATPVASEHAWAFMVHPKIRLLVFGAGSEALLLARLGDAADMEVEIRSPDAPTVARAAKLGLSANTLQGLSAPLDFAADEITAVALMFHDHEWEQRILLGALAGPAFYIGALGSHRAHLRRVDALMASGCPARAIARIKAPIGLVHRLRDPNLLAASVLAEIAAAFQKRFVAF